jgi:hypothetical protein
MKFPLQSTLRHDTLNTEKERKMFRKKQLPQKDYDRENWKPILKCSICNGERVAGFKNIHTGEFREELFIQEEAQLEEFRQRYKITELPKEY